MEGQEMWKDIPNYEGYYQVSNLGRVKSLERDAKYRKDPNRVYHKKEIIVNQHPDKKGYFRVKIYDGFANGKTIAVHRLVALAFIPNIHNLSQVNHIDGNKINNKTSNLEWCTHAYNTKHAYENGLKKPENYKGEGNSTSKLNNEKVLNIRRDRINGMTLNQLATKYFISVSNIHAVVNRLTWTHI